LERFGVRVGRGREVRKGRRRRTERRQDIGGVDEGISTRSDRSVRLGSATDDI